MAKSFLKENNVVLVLSDKEAVFLGVKANKEFELFKAKDGLWVLSEKPQQPAPAKPQEQDYYGKLDETGRSIVSLLQKKRLQERVEGLFEKYLNDRELKKFSELLRQGTIVKFKLSPQYKKAVYKLREEVEANPAKKEEGENPKIILAEPSNAAPTGIPPTDSPAVFSLERDGFTILKSEEEAKMLSMELAEDIKSGNVKGLKSFDGEFFVIVSELYKKISPKVLAEIQAGKSIYLSELSKKTNLPRTLVKGVCEFLKEEGSILEKKKDLYKFIG